MSPPIPGGGRQQPDYDEWAFDLVVVIREVRQDMAVVDGISDDSLVAPWGEELRVGNIETPEVGSRCKCASECASGDRATAFTRDVIRAARRVTLMPHREAGRKFREYGRSGPLDPFRGSFVLVSIDGSDLGESLMRAGLARRWDGGTVASKSGITSYSAVA